MDKLAIIDDESLVMGFYQREIERLGLDIEIELIRRISDAKRWVESNCSEIFLLVVDTMLPPDDVFSMEETNRGLLTGVKFVQLVRNELQYDGRIFVLTNLSEEMATDEYIRQDDNCRILCKRTCHSRAFAKLVRSCYETLGSKR